MNTRKAPLSASTSSAPVSRRKALAAVSMSLMAPAFAQTDPSRPITLLVGYSAGSTFDSIARAVADLAGKRLGQTVVVENRAGAGGAIANALGAKAAPDGHTILIGGAGSHVLTAVVRPNLPYDTEKDFVTIYGMASLPVVMVVPASSPVRSVDDFIARGRQNLGKVNFGSSGLGTSSHLAGELFNQRSSLKMTHVPYKDNNVMKTDLIAGRLDVVFDALPALIGLIESNQLRPLAVTNAKRSLRFPDVPTLTELGIKNFTIDSWVGIFAPRGISDENRRRLSEAFAEVVRSEEGRRRLMALGAEPNPSDAAGLDRLWRGDIQHWRKFIADSGTKVSE